MKISGCPLWKGKVKMKRQRFRFKLIALLLTGLITLAAVYGIFQLPRSGSQTDLRDSILQLTQSGSSQGNTSREDTAGAVLPSNSADPSLEQLSSEYSPASSEPEPNAAATPVPPLPEALSEFFSSGTPFP